MSQHITDTSLQGRDPGLGWPSAVEQSLCFCEAEFKPQCRETNPQTNTQTINKPTENTETDPTGGRVPFFSEEVGHCPGFLRGCIGVYTMRKLVVLVLGRL